MEVGLREFNSCSQLLEHFQTEALNRVGPYGLDDSGPPTIAFAQPAIARADSIQESANALTDSGADFSETNVQVKGVDEPDIVKTDGKRIVGFTNGNLWVADAERGSASLLGSLNIDREWKRYELFLSDNKVLLIGSAFGIVERPQVLRSTLPEQFADKSHTLILEIDISDNQPQLVRELTVQGRHISSRKVGDFVRVAIGSEPTELPFVYPGNNSEAAMERAEEANREVIPDTTLENWLPSYVLAEGAEIKKEGSLTPCDQVFVPQIFSGLDTTSILTFNLNQPLDNTDSVSLIADDGTLFSSGQSIYIAHQVWPRFTPEPVNAVESEGPDIDFGQNTDNSEGNGELDEDDDNPTIWIHKFSTPDARAASYEATGQLKGRLLNQFSMHETPDGHFWIVTTRDNRQREDLVSESYITSFSQTGAELIQQGVQGGLGRNEQVQSVRFIQNTAYVVTFRRIDPLYVIDLTQPAAPRITGELKIPGFSSYLHPLGNAQSLGGNFLLGVGRVAELDGTLTGEGKLSIFDVTDPSNPKESAELVLGEGFTDVQWDHRAFLYWHNANTAVLPFSSYRTNFYGAVAVRLNPPLTEEGSVRERDRISHNPVEIECPGDKEPPEPGPDPTTPPTSTTTNEGLSADESTSDSTSNRDELSIREECRLIEGGRESIERALVIGDTLWTLSNNYLESRDLESLVQLDRVPLNA